MPRYETVFVLDPSLDEKAVPNEIKKVEDLIRDHKGEVLKIDKWGKKRFAYPIKKKHEGFYTLILFEGEGGIQLICSPQLFGNSTFSDSLRRRRWNSQRAGESI